MKERTHFFIKIYLSHFILERVMFLVCERWVGDGDRLLFWPKVLLTIAALLPHLGWVAQPWVTASCSHAGILSPTGSSWLEPPGSPDYIIVYRRPDSVVLPLIYTGVSLDWRLGRGSICYRYKSSFQLMWLLLYVHVCYDVFLYWYLHCTLTNLLKTFARS